jgi:GT2 family glycosyltransferase
MSQLRPRTPEVLRRPGVSIVIPFAGSSDNATRMLASFAGLRLRPEDELIVVDNSDEQVVPAAAGGAARVVPAVGERSSYYARNVGVEEAANDWLLLTDADCLPSPGIVDAYFDPTPGDRCGAIAGEIVGDPAQTNFVARWARSRRVLRQRSSLAHEYRPYASTANLLVHRPALDHVGGFVEGVQSAGDADLCWRLQEAGWTLEYREQAWIYHHHRESLRGLLRQSMRYGAGRAWLRRRFQDLPRDSGMPRWVARSVAAAVLLLLTGRRERAGFRALDALFAAAGMAAAPLSNRPGRARPKRGCAQTMCFEEFPPPRWEAGAIGARRELSECHIEALRRPFRSRASEVRGLDIAYVEDDGAARRALAAGVLALSHPLRSGRFVVGGGPGGGVRRSIFTLAPAVRRVSAAGAPLGAPEASGQVLADSIAWLAGRAAP